MDATSKLEIHELLARVAYALDERDVPMLTACFAEDARMVIDIEGVPDEMEFEGRDTIMGLMTASMEEQTDQRRHVTTNIFITDQSESSATVTSNLTLTGVENGAIRLITSGYYKDSVSRSANGWVFSERRIELDMPY